VEERKKAKENPGGDEAKKEAITFLNLLTLFLIFR
jgi:hypothetical protein